MRYNVGIKLLMIDVDGTLTDGTVFYGDQKMEIKAFNIKDGLIIKALSNLGINVVFLTGRESAATERRAAELGATAIQGVEDKETKMNELFIEYGVKPEQSAYIGDDLNDYAAMSICGFKACPADAASEIQDICDYISPLSGGHGAVRDICEYMLKQNGSYSDLLDSYIDERN